MAAQDTLPSDRYLDAADTRRYVGDVTDMTIWRWLHNATLNFPQPSVINGRRYWRKSELDEFLESRKRATVADCGQR